MPKHGPNNTNKSNKNVQTYIPRPSRLEQEASLAASIQRWMGKSAGPHSLSGSVDTQANSGIQQFVRIKQMYWERALMGDATSAPYHYTFRLNSTFDPNETGTGLQPKGRDQMAAIYNDYTVMSARYEVEYVNVGTTRKFVGLLVGTDAPGNFSIATMAQAEESCSKYSKCQIMYGTGVSNNVVFKGNVNMEDFALETGGSLSEQFSCGVGANPSTPVRLHLFAWDEDGTAIATNGLAARVRIIYDVVYHGVVASTFS